MGCPVWKLGQLVFVRYRRVAQGSTSPEAPPPRPPSRSAARVRTPTRSACTSWVTATTTPPLAASPSPTPQPRNQPIPPRRRRPRQEQDPTGLFSWPDVGSAIGGARGWPRCCNSCGRSLRRDGRIRRRGRWRGNGRPVGVAPVQGWEPWSREETATLPRTLSLAASSADSSAERKSDQQGERLCLTRARRMRSLGSAACSSH